ncbi:MAG TPA: histidine kinase dimerization/phospho-acceptor domain-containing protein, partial [Candidatus Dormibacteraeota bacterium]|nr:histidine kinase dimerization/phospho-acceptor domain-containing protein [Candidatus Dormibacteraeota bacterium]
MTVRGGGPAPFLVALGRGTGPAIAAGLATAATLGALTLIPARGASALSWWIPTMLAASVLAAATAGVFALDRTRSPEGRWARILGVTCLVVAVLLLAALLLGPHMLGVLGPVRRAGTVAAWLAEAAVAGLALALTGTPPRDPSRAGAARPGGLSPAALGALAVLGGAALAGIAVAAGPLLPRLGPWSQPTLAGHVLAILPLVALEFPLATWTRRRWRQPRDPLAPWIQGVSVLLLGFPAVLLFAAPQSPVWYGGWATLPLGLQILVLALVFSARVEGDRRRGATQRLRRITAAIRSAGNLDPLLVEVAATALDLTEADAAGISWQNEGQPEMVLRAVAPGSADQALPALRAAVAMAPSAAVGGEPATLTVSGDPLTPDPPLVVTLLPFHVVGHAEAALLVAHRGGRDVGADEQEVLRALAGFAALATQQACLVGELRGTLATLDEAVVVSDARGRITAVNDAAHRILPGCEPGILLHAFLTGLDWRGADGEPITSGQLPAVRALAPVDGEPAAAEAGEPLTEARLRGPDAERILAMDANPLPGAVGGTVAVFRDITGQRELDQMKDAFVATASHELRTPLTSICGAAALLRSGAIPLAEGMDFLKIIDDEANRLHLLVEDLLALSRIEDAASELNITPVRVGALLEEVLEAVRPDPAHPVSVEVGEACT